MVVAGVDAGEAGIGLRAAAVLRRPVAGLELVGVVAELAAEGDAEWGREDPRVERPVDVEVGGQFAVVVLAGMEVGGRVAEGVQEILLIEAMVEMLSTSPP